MATPASFPELQCHLFTYAKIMLINDLNEKKRKKMKTTTIESTKRIGVNKSTITMSKHQFNNDNNSETENLLSIAI